MGGSALVHMHMRRSFYLSTLSIVRINKSKFEKIPLKSMEILEIHPAEAQVSEKKEG